MNLEFFPPENKFKGLKMSAKSSEYQNGCYLSKCRMYDVIDGRRLFPHCNRYSCPLHGWKRAKDLREAVQSYLDKFQIIRFWSFTLSSKNFKDIETHYRILSKAWRYFVTYIRRDRNITDVEKNLQYIKVVEPHKSGFFHLHAFFDRYVQQQKIYVLWNTAIRTASGDDKLRGGCYVVGRVSSTKAANYVTKYVMKSAKMMTFRLHYYSRSSKVKLFPEKIKNPNIAFFAPVKGCPGELECTNCQTISVNGCINPLLVVSIDNFTDLSGNSPPKTCNNNNGTTTGLQLEFFPSTMLRHKTYFSHYSESYLREK